MGCGTGAQRIGSGVRPLTCSLDKTTCLLENTVLGEIYPLNRWAEVKTPEGADDGHAAIHPAIHPKRQPEHAEHFGDTENLSEFFRERGFSVHFRDARPSLYATRPIVAAGREEYRSVGLVREIFGLAANTMQATVGDQARWQRDATYELGQSLRASVRAVHALDTWAGRKGDRYTDILGLHPVEKIDGWYHLNCKWCSTRFKAKRSHARYHSDTCRQRGHRRTGRGTDDRLFNNAALHQKIQADKALIGAIREIAFFAPHPRCGILTRGADALELIDADLVTLTAELYKET